MSIVPARRIPACVGFSTLFDSTDPDSHRDAAAICATCPMLAECGETDPGDYEGVWAGRLVGPRLRPSPKKEPVVRICKHCESEHGRKRSEFCSEQCAKAARTASKRKHDNRRNTKPVAVAKKLPTWRPSCGTASGYRGHSYRNEFACDGCKKGKAASERERLRRRDLLAAADSFHEEGA